MGQVDGLRRTWRKISIPMNGTNEQRISSMRPTTQRYAQLIQVLIGQEEDRKKPKFDDIDITDLVPEQEQETDIILEAGPKTLSKREKVEKKRKIEELLDETVPLNVCTVSISS